MGAGWKHGRARGAGHGPAQGEGAGPAGGPGWGGAAAGKERAALTPEAARLAVQKRDDPEAREAREALAAEMLAKLHELATTGEAEAVRMHAADKVLDRVLGRPQQAVQHTGANGGAVRLTWGDGSE